MANWRPVDVRLWNDRKFLACGDGARLLWLFLLTCPSLPIPGVVLGGEAALAEMLGWTPERLRERFAELSRNGLRVRREARIVWLQNALKYQPPSNPNMVKGWGKKWDDVPEGDLKLELWEALRIACKPWSVLFGKLFAKPLAEGSGNGSVNRSGNGSAHEHQHENEHQHDHDPEEEDLSPSACAIPPAVPEQVPTTPPPAPSVPAVSLPPAFLEEAARTLPDYSREPVSNSSLVAQSCDLIVGQTTRNAPENIRDATLRANPPPAPPIATYDPDDPLARGRLAQATWRRVSDARISIATEIKLPAPLPLDEITPATRPRGFDELSTRIREAGARAPEVCDRVVENLVRQARAKRSLDWLSERAFGDKAWPNARDGIDPSARSAPGQRAGPQPAAARPRDRDPPAKPIPRDQLAGPEQFAEARELLAKAMTSNDDDTPDQQPRRRKAGT